jgi:IS5 family transposase
MNAKNKKQRKAGYTDLLKVAEMVTGYARSAVERLTGAAPAAKALEMSGSIKHYAELAEQVIDQTRRRVLLGEKVPSSQKVVSIGEDVVQKFFVSSAIYIKHRFSRFKTCLKQQAFLR